MERCIICGKPTEANQYIKSVRKELQERHMCFSCSFWTTIIQEYNSRYCVANGTCYTIGNENSSSRFRGFDGAKVTINYKDGRVVKTSNLWCRGDVPKHFRRQLPDDAELVWNWDEVNKRLEETLPFLSMKYLLSAVIAAYLIVITYHAFVIMITKNIGFFGCATMSGCLLGCYFAAFIVVFNMFHKLSIVLVSIILK